MKFIIELDIPAITECDLTGMQDVANETIAEQLDNLLADEAGNPSYPRLAGATVLEVHASNDLMPQLHHKETN